MSSNEALFLIFFQILEIRKSLNSMSSRQRRSFSCYRVLVHIVLDLKDRYLWEEEMEHTLRPSGILSFFLNCLPSDTAAPGSGISAVQSWSRSTLLRIWTTAPFTYSPPSSNPSPRMTRVYDKRVYHAPMHPRSVSSQLPSTLHLYFLFLMRRSFQSYLTLELY